MTQITIDKAYNAGRLEERKKILKTLETALGVYRKLAEKSQLYMEETNFEHIPTAIQVIKRILKEI